MKTVKKIGVLAVALVVTAFIGGFIEGASGMREGSADTLIGIACSVVAIAGCLSILTDFQGEIKETGDMIRRLSGKEINDRRRDLN